MPLSSLQLARLVQAYVAEPGGSLEEKASRAGVRRSVLLRAGRGTISRTTRLRLLAFFAAAGVGRGGLRASSVARRPRRQPKRGVT